MGIPFYLILRRGCSPLFSAALTLAILLTGYQEEVFIFGGYPQLLATTFLLLTVYWLMDGLISGGRRPLLLAGASTALVAGTHHFTLVVMAPTLLVLGVALFIQERPPIRPLLRNAGVKEIHLRVSSPPIISPCFYGMDFPTREELMASSRSVEEIRRFIDVDSLGYLSLPGLLKSVPNGSVNYCHSCFSGAYPTEIPPDLKKSCLESATPNSHIIDALSLRYEKK
jgi:hypothetical protein